MLPGSEEKKPILIERKNESKCPDTVSLVFGHSIGESVFRAIAGFVESGTRQKVDCSDIRPRQSSYAEGATQCCLAPSCTPRPCGNCEESKGGVPCRNRNTRRRTAVGPGLLIMPKRCTEESLEEVNCWRDAEHVRQVSLGGPYAVW